MLRTFFGFGERTGDGVEIRFSYSKGIISAEGPKSESKTGNKTSPFKAETAITPQKT